jgi:hypothetical protein
MKRKVSKPKKVKTIVTPKFSISMQHGNQTFTGTGETIYDALSTMNVPIKITNKVILRVTDGTKKLEKMYMPVKAKRLFFPLAQRVISKQLSLLLR